MMLVDPDPLYMYNNYYIYVIIRMWSSDFIFMVAPRNPIGATIVGSLASQPYFSQCACAGLQD